MAQGHDWRRREGVPQHGPKMTAARRRSLPKSKFGLPSKHKYPMDTKGRARNAKGRATQQVKKGNLSPSSAAHIKAMANRILGKSDTQIYASGGGG